MRRALLLLLLFGCSEGGPLFLPYPPLNGAKTVMVAVEQDDGLDVHVVDVAGDIDALKYALHEGRAFNAKALMYEESVEALGMQAGLLQSLAPGEGEPLPSPREIYATEVTPEEGEARWRLDSALGTKLAAFRHAPTPLCFELASKTVELPTDKGSVYALKVSAELALVGARNGIAYWVDSAGRVSTPPNAPPRAMTAAAAAPDGSLWFADHTGGIWNGTVTEAAGWRVTRVTTNPLRNFMYFMAVGPASDGQPEVYTMDDTGAYYRFHDGGWQLLQQFTDNMNTRRMGGIVRLGPGRAIAAWNVDRFVVWFDNGALRTEEIHPTDGLTSIAQLGEGDIMVGTAFGELVRWQTGTGWRVLPGIRHKRWVQQIEPYPGGFMYGTAFGGVYPYLWDGPICEPAVSHPDNAENVVVFDSGGMLVVGLNPNEAGNLPITIAHP